MEAGELLGLEGWKDGGMLHICSDRTFHYRDREVAPTKMAVSHIRIGKCRWLVNANCSFLLYQF